MIVGIIQARSGSTRLPGKVLAPILGEPMLARQIERLRLCSTLDSLIVATSTEAGDDAIADLCRELAIDCYRGSHLDVLDRFYQTAAGAGATHVVRLTGDCPLIDPGIVDRIVRTHLEQGNDYTSNVVERTYPDGLDAEIFRFSALEAAWDAAKSASEREHVTPFIYRNGDRFRLGTVLNDTDLAALRWTVDEEADLRFVRSVFEALYPENPAFTMQDILNFLSS